MGLLDAIKGTSKKNAVEVMEGVTLFEKENTFRVIEYDEKMVDWNTVPFLQELTKSNLVDTGFCWGGDTEIFYNTKTGKVVMATADSLYNWDLLSKYLNKNYKYDDFVRISSTNYGVPYPLDYYEGEERKEIAVVELMETISIASRQHGLVILPADRECELCNDFTDAKDKTGPFKVEGIEHFAFYISDINAIDIDWLNDRLKPRLQEYDKELQSEVLKEDIPILDDPDEEEDIER